VNQYLVRSTVVGALGGLLFGFDTAVISGTTAQLTQVFALSHATLGVTVSIALAGTVIGAASSGILGQRLGGREALRIMAVLYLASAIGCAFSWNWPSLLAFRFLGGLGIGGSSVLAPVYIAEMAPANLRGRLVGMFQINIVVGILLAYASNFALASHFAAQATNAATWRWEFGVAAFPAAIFFVLLFTIPQSARWLVTRNRAEEARGVLQLLGTPDADAELRDIQASIHFERSTLHEPLFQKKYLFPIGLAIAIAAFNQLSGINAILYYANDIFAQAGFSRASGDLQAVLIGAVNLLFTLIGMALIDRVGRKTLLLAGGVGMALALSGVGFIFFFHAHQNLLVWMLMGFIASFAVSQGAVVWVYLSEIFPNRVRAKGQSLGSLTHWVMNGLISLTFPSLRMLGRGSLPFFFFAACMVVMLVVVAGAFPETKGLSLEQLQRKLKIA
jgi:SP family arabinose:H+ symporter-like MFS transporter